MARHQHTLFIVIGAKRIEYAVYAAGQSLHDHSGVSDIDLLQGIQAPGNAVQAALESVSAQLDLLKNRSERASVGGGRIRRSDRDKVNVTAQANQQSGYAVPSSLVQPLRRITGTGVYGVIHEDSDASANFGPTPNHVRAVGFARGLLTKPSNNHHPLSPTSAMQVRVLVADCWLAIGSIPWHSDLQHAASAPQFARQQFINAGFTVAADDCLRLNCAAFAQPRLAVVYPAWLLAALRQCAQRCDATLESVLPLSVASWNVVRTQIKTIDFLAVVIPGMFVIAQGDGLVDVTVRVDHQASAEQLFTALSAQWQRMQVRDPQLAQPGVLKLLDLNTTQVIADNNLYRLPLPSYAPGLAVTPSLHVALLASRQACWLDALRVGKKVTRWQWLVLSIALALTLGVTALAWQTSQRVERITQQQQATRAVTTSTPWSPEQVARIQAVNGAIRELNFPVFALLGALQPPEEMRVTVLSVDLSAQALSNAVQGAKTSIRIVAESPTSSAMAQYVKFIDERKPFVDAYLTQHEIIDSANQRTYRFTVETLWAQ